MGNDRSSNISVRVKNSVLDKIQEYVENHDYHDVSHFIREACQFQMDFIDKQEYFKNNPEEALNYLNEQGVKLDKKKMNESILGVYKGLEEEDKEKLFLGIALERKTRAENKLQSAKNKRWVMQRGGEFEPKIGYTKHTMNNYVYFCPIIPSDDNQYHNYWSTLTIENKQTLLAELRTKLIDLESKGFSDSELHMLKNDIEEISKGIKEEVGST